MTTIWLVSARAIHIGACLLFFGVFAFDRFAVASISASDRGKMAGYWESRLKIFSAFLLPIIFFSGFAWFALVAMNMSGGPLQTEVLQIVWTQTQFGSAWKFRLIFWLAALAAAVCGFSGRTASRRLSAGLQLIFGGALLGSLAWSGHGLEGSRWHLCADALHLLVAGLWPTGLLPLFLLLRQLRNCSGVGRGEQIAALVRRFSALSLGSVALLVATGLVNTWFLAGSLPNLFGQAYGWVLLAKIALFIFAVAIGAVNLLLLKPRLTVETAQPQNAGKTVVRLQSNVLWELILGTAIVIVLAILGVLPPANH